MRRAALNCLDATWSLICFAEWSQGNDYDEDRAALHLAAINVATETFKRAKEVFDSPGLFDTLAQAAVGEGPRPDFRYGSVYCATAHEAAFELLRRVVLWAELGFDDLRDDPPDDLRNILSRLEKRKPLRNLLDGRGVHQVRAWIDREWAAIEAATLAPEVDEGAAVNKEAMALAILAQHPDWSDAEIARNAGCSRTSLYRWPKYVQAREILEQGKHNLPIGAKGQDGKLEAWNS